MKVIYTKKILQGNPPSPLNRRQHIIPSASSIAILTARILSLLINLISRRGHFKTLWSWNYKQNGRELPFLKPKLQVSKRSNDYNIILESRHA